MSTSVRFTVYGRSLLQLREAAHNLALDFFDDAAYEIVSLEAKPHRSDAGAVAIWEAEVECGAVDAESSGRESQAAGLASLSASGLTAR